MFEDKAARIIYIKLAVLGMLMFTGCESDDITGPEEDHGVVEVVIEPQEVEIEVGTQQPFEGLLKDAQGNTVDPAGLDGFNIDWEWWSSDTDVFTVEQDGSAGIGTGESEGEAYCIIEVTITHGNSNFTGRDSSFVFLF